MAPTHKAENAPRVLGRRVTSVTNIVRDASRRRRDRVYSRGTNSVQESIHRLKVAASAVAHRPQQTLPRELPTPPTSPAAGSSTIPSISVSTDAPAPAPTRIVKEIRLRFPSILKRPPGRAIPTENLESLGPGFPPAAFARDALEATGLGTHLYRVCQSVESVNAIGLPALPTSFKLTVSDLSAATPDRLLAVYKDGPVVEKKRVYTLFPIHDVVISTQCINLPAMEPTQISPPRFAEEKVDLPTFELPMPHAESMRDIIRYLYTKDKGQFIGSLIPLASHSPPASDYPGNTPIIRFGHLVAQTFTSFSIMRHLTHCHGVYKNMCFLGIRDDAAWQLLNIAWQVLLRAFAESTGQEDALKNVLVD